MASLTDWSTREKKIARQVFDQAVEAELQSTLAEFKAKAAAVTDPHDIWEIGEWLEQRRRQIDQKYDYRYSQLLSVFGRLVREGRIHMADLAGLDDEKLARIIQIAQL